MTAEEFISGIEKRHPSANEIQLRDLAETVREFSAKNIGRIWNRYIKTWDKNWVPKPANLFRIAENCGVPKNRTEILVGRCKKCGEPFDTEITNRCTSCGHTEIIYVAVPWKLQ